jgi:hypothetical protein
MYGVGVSNQFFSAWIYTYTHSLGMLFLLHYCVTRIVPLWEHYSFYPPSSCSSTISRGLQSPAYPHPFTFPIRIECLLTFAFVVIVPIEALHAILAGRTTRIVELGRAFCSKCILLGRRRGVRELIILVRPWERTCRCRRRHRKVVMSIGNRMWSLYGGPRHLEQIFAVDEDGSIGYLY